MKLISIKQSLLELFSEDPEVLQKSKWPYVLVLSQTPMKNGVLKKCAISSQTRFI